MRPIFRILRFLCSLARKAFSLYRVFLSLPFHRIVATLKRFILNGFKSLPFTDISTVSPRVPSSSETETNTQTSNHGSCFPSVLPLPVVEHYERPQDAPTILPDAIIPSASLPTPPRPLLPEWFRRDEHRQPVKRLPNKDKIKAGQISFSEYTSYTGRGIELTRQYSRNTPGSWERVVHPEGARYYYHPQKNVLTDARLTEPGDLANIDACIDYLRRRESQLLPSSISRTYFTQLVVQRMDSEQWGYYFVNHHTRALFWIEDFDVAGILQSVEGVTEDSHITYAVERQYWLHCEQYPTALPLLQEHVTELWGTLVFAYMDSMTSVAPLCPFHQDDVSQILGLMPFLEARVCKTDGYAMWVLARAMGLIAQGKFHHFFGQPGARLEADLSVYTKKSDRKEKHFLFSVLDFLLCFSFSSHVKELESIWVDDIISYSTWKNYITRLSGELGGYPIYSTVMLAVDISLLAVPAVNRNDVTSQSASIVAIYVSLLCVIGSLVSSIQLARQLRAMNGVDDAAIFMHRMVHWKGGVAILGVIFSLPYALLIWAVFFFALALLYTIVQEANHASLGIMVTVTTVVVAVISLPTWWGKDYRGHPEWLSILLAWLSQGETQRQELPS